MKIIVKGTFDRDADKAHSKELRLVLDYKIIQIEQAKNLSHITGVKLLEGYSNHYRIIVKSKNQSYRIGAIIRNETVWLVQFLPRRIIYKSFP
jgi:hypothetical protein